MPPGQALFLCLLSGLRKQGVLGALRLAPALAAGPTARSKALPRRVTVWILTQCSSSLQLRSARFSGRPPQPAVSSGHARSAPWSPECSRHFKARQPGRSPHDDQPRGPSAARSASILLPPVYRPLS
ncbi:hypothetical protein NDU88_004428 [Pleurodeles waltl]|uniref:Secreted protein n=1 Tax=Pleurodeles waltl TaxID=8319 RepID=A0AAV7SIR3_PLEWA|nr:hypothetical protein NDU88_004428 [Pleurodeles waltl]